MTTAAEIARLRQGLYRFFGGALVPPSHAHLEELAAAADYLEAMDLADYAFSREWRFLMRVLESGVDAVELASEHVRLFESGTNGVLCPPIESFYRADGRHERVADVVRAIERDYREIGVAMANTGAAPDHVTTQLEIMSALCARESEAWDGHQENESEKYLDAEVTFLSHHLSAWLPQLRVRVVAADPSDFYITVLDAVHSFVVHDRDLIAGVRRWAGVVA